MISIITVTYNSRKEIEIFLASLNRIRPAIKDVMEVFVWDNDSSDGTKEFLLSRQESEETLRATISPRNVGLSKAVNRMIARTKGDLILFANPDIIVDTTFLDLLRYAKAHRFSGAVPEFCNQDGIPQRVVNRRVATTTRILLTSTTMGKYIIKAFPWIDRNYLYANRRFEIPEEIEQPGCSCLLISREAVERASNQGQFYDERFPVFWNDVDLFFRAREHGVNFVLVPSAKVIHSLGHSVKRIDTEFLAMLFWSSAGLIGIAEKWNLKKTVIRMWMFADAIFLASIKTLALLTGRRSSRDRRTFGGEIKTGILKFRCTLR